MQSTHHHRFTFAFSAGSFKKVVGGPQSPLEQDFSTYVGVWQNLIVCCVFNVDGGSDRKINFLNLSSYEVH